MSLTNGTAGITFAKRNTKAHDHNRYIQRQVTLPKAIREAAGIKPGDKVDIRRHGVWRHLYREARHTPRL